MKISFLFGLLVLLFACNSIQDESKDLNTSNYKIEITDSIQINRLLSYPSIVSVHPKNGNILFLTTEGDRSIIFVVNQEGQVIQEFEHLKEGPTSAGSYLISASFFEDGYAIMGIGNLVIYDADFNVKKKLKIPLNLGGMIYIHVKHLKVIEKDGKSKLLISYGPDTEKQNKEAEYYDEYNLLTLVDPETETFEPFGRFHEGSMFRSGRAFYYLRNFYDVKGEMAKVIVNNDTVLYTFDNSGTEIKRTKIPFDDYFMFKGFSLGPQGIEEQNEMRDIPGEILGLVHVDGFDIISYKSGLSLESVLEMAGPKGERYDRKEFDRANPPKVIILKDGELVSEVMPLPKKITELSVRDPFGNIWASQNVNALSEEPEVVTFYKLRIVEK